MWSDGQGHVVVQKRGVLVMADDERAAPRYIEGRCRSCLKSGATRATPRMSWAQVVSRLDELLAARGGRDDVPDTRLIMDW